MDIVEDLFDLHSLFFPCFFAMTLITARVKCRKSREDTNPDDKCLSLTMDWSIPSCQWNLPCQSTLSTLHSDVEAAVSNGATFMPKTFTMQELTRMSLDEYFESLEGSVSPGEPVIYSVRKGCVA